MNISAHSIFTGMRSRHQNTPEAMLTRIERRAMRMADRALARHGRSLPVSSSRTVRQPVNSRCKAPKLDLIGQDPLHRHEEVGIGAVVVASMWLVFCVIASVHSLAFGS
jgi:hypothetical protein